MWYNKRYYRMSQWVKNLGERLKALELGERYIRRS